MDASGATDSDYPLPPEFTEFWYITYHTLFWLDLYLTGSLEGFAPLPPFTLAEPDPAGALPERPDSQDELHAYPVYLRQKCQATIAGLSDEKAHQQAAFPWTGKNSNALFRATLVQHAPRTGTCGPVNMFLGHNTSDGASDWVPWVKADEGGE